VEVERVKLRVDNNFYLDLPKDDTLKEEED
jgi:hypothetical protein